MLKIDNRNRLTFSGIATVVVLLITAIVMLFLSKNSFFPQKGLHIAVPNKKYSYFEDYKTHPKRAYKIFLMRGNNKVDGYKFKNAQNFIKELSVQQDTIKGIRFVFSSKAKYKTVISILDFCVKDEVIEFSLDGYNLWVFNVSKSEGKFRESKFDQYYEESLLSYNLDIE